MGLRKLKPITAGSRHRQITDFVEITTDSPEKSLLSTSRRSGGRNNTGKMTVRYIGGGHKKKYRIVDFLRDKTGVPGVVKTVEYDPNRTARIALVFYKDGEKRYILAPHGIKVGQNIVSGTGAEPTIGNSMPMKDMPLGATIHNIELHPGKGGQICRSAGTYAQLTAKEGRYVVIKLPSGETRRVLSVCTATIGSVSNPEHENTQLGKAGANRWKGRRPRNRGVAMNPVDHPMGGGEGRASGGHPRSRKGIPAKGYKTRSKTKYSNKYIISRRNKAKGGA